MPKLILFNKPYFVLSKFRDEQKRKTLADFLKIPHVYPCGRLDYDSEGLILLTDLGWLQNLISSPKHKLPKTYLVQVEGEISNEAIEKLSKGALLRDGKTLPAKAKKIPVPSLWERTPPIRFRKNIPDSWIEITICEGKNRQVRRMTAAVGFATLRLVRKSIGSLSIDGIKNGEYKEIVCPTNMREARTLLTIGEN
ncbi:MAG: pseudouridine synthase [Chitinispirillales bacterium]|jgi:23S rRNA pseudouridine2457 synthase|nr:pseudouridine synthase [Chitinispirillales bacterium]